jgi:hypothetical protein
VGNSEWIYFAPYQEDAAAALRGLRRGDFAAGRYFKGYGYEEDEVPSSLSELVQRTTYRTHSILDVGFIAPPPLDKTEPNIDVQGRWQVASATEPDVTAEGDAPPSLPVGWRLYSARLPRDQEAAPPQRPSPPHFERDRKALLVRDHLRVAWTAAQQLPVGRRSSSVWQVTMLSCERNRREHARAASADCRWQ